VALHMVQAGWPEGTAFADEPVAPGSARNPEMLVSTPQRRVGVEVKAPSLLAHEAQRGSPSTARWRPHPATGQARRHRGRRGQPDLTPRQPGEGLPDQRDAKFAAFRAQDDGFFGLLAIVWDDFIYEPITALLHPSSGLLTEKILRSR